MNKKYLFTIKLLAILGIGLALYLLWQQLFQPAFQLCSINETINCDAVISGPVAKTFGIPTPLIGLVGYLIILTGAILRKKYVIFSMASFGLLFCLWIAYKELFELHVICPVCIACQLIMITIFTLSVIMLKKN